MKRLFGALTKAVGIVALIALAQTTSSGQANVSQAEVFCVNVNGVESGTDNSQFIFRCYVDPGTNGFANLPGLGGAVAVYIDPLDLANPEAGAATRILMQPDPTRQPTSATNVPFVAYIKGSDLDGGSRGQTSFQHNYSIVARNNSTGGTFQNGIGAAPKPAPPLVVAASGGFEIMPVDQNYVPDKRLTPGQLGNGLRVNPQDTTTPNDGGSSHYYTWRVRLRSPGGLPPEPFFRRSQYEWHDPRPEINGTPFYQLYDSGVVLVLIDPSGGLHYCPMEIDPDAPGQGPGPISPLQSFLQPVQVNVFGSILHPTVGTNWTTTQGVFYRYKMLPTQYQQDWFGGPTVPDGLPSIPVGGTAPFGPEIVGRPFANEYTGFAGEDPSPFAPPFPFFTNTAHRSGQWKYYYQVTTDFRPVPRGGFPDNGSLAIYLNNGLSIKDPYGADPGGYITAIDSDNGPFPGNANTPYLHPFISPILSDGGWTDDLPENQPLQPNPANGDPTYGGTSNNAHRSRVTTRTKVRFLVRVTKADNNPLPAQAVRIWIDGTAHTMGQFSGNDFTQGIVFNYDTNFPPGTEGQHRIYFDADDGIHKAIWPRRPTSDTDPGATDPQYPDPQLVLRPFAPMAAQPNPVNFGTLTEGLNYLNEPYVNHRPTLNNPSLSPTSGVEAQPYTYEVTYTDLDGDEPMDAYVFIDGNDDAHKHRMTPVDNTPVTQGRKYRFVLTSLVPTLDRKHTYFFQFRDNWAAAQPIRREYGEWVNLPQGNDYGQPTSVISGPIITGNNPPELTDPQFFFSDPAQTSATLYDFVVRYKDADNDPPANIAMYISADGGATYDGGTALVKAENSSNYVAGVQYHLPNRIRLAVGSNYRYKFEASDGAHPPPNDTKVIHVGTGSDAIATATTHTLTPSDGTNQDFVDAIGTKQWQNTGIYVWVGSGATPTMLIQNDPGPLGYHISGTNDGIVLNTPTTQPVRVSYFYVETLGPVIHTNHAPTLAGPTTDATTNYGTLTPQFGSPNSSFTYTIIYTDQDNQPPAYVNLLVDTNQTFAMTMDPATPTPVDYTRGVKFNVTITGTTLGNGNHKYHFEASDGADLGRFPLSTANPPELNGPDVANIGDLGTPIIQPFPKGKHNDLYTFTVTYKNTQGIAPTFPIEVRIKDNASGQVTNEILNPIDPIGPQQYINGVRYQIALTAPTAPLTPGNHDITFGFQGQPASTTPQTLIVNAQPVLSSPTVTPQTASQAGDIAFAVTYSDLNGDPPKDANGASTIKLFIDGTEYTAVAPTTAGTDFTAGVVYTWTIQAKNLTIGNHTYYFTAADDLEPANPQFVPALPGGSFTIKAAAQPQLIEPTTDPTTNNGTLTPIKGAKSTQYTYYVRYFHGDNVPPVSIQVHIDAGTANAKVVDMTPAPGQPQPLNYASPGPGAKGVLYQYQTQPGDLAPGTHTYYFEVSDRLVTVDLPSNPTANKYTGPTVNFPPTLTNPTAFVVGTTPPLPTVNGQNQLTPPVKGNITTKFVFQTTYTDPDFVAGTTPTVTLTIDNSTTVTLKPKAGDPLNYTQGVVYTSDEAGMTLTPGQKVFHFDASDGLDSARIPAAANSDITGLTVANVPSLLPPAPNTPATNNGTIDKTSGPLSTTFTYSIVYQNLDNTAPAFVNLIIDDLTNKQTVAMQKVGTSVNYAAGVTYQAQYRFNSGTTHTYRFEAEDTVSPSYVAHYPTDGSDITGPAINIPTFSAPTFNPAKPIVGQPLTITSKLNTTNPIATDIAIQLVRPDGTGISDKATTDTQGNFNYTFTPTQTGDWTIQFSYGGVAGVTDPVTATFPFNVSGFTITLAAGTEDMIASPLVPTTPDPGLTFNPTDSTGASLPITVLDLIKWIPDGTGTSGHYSALNTDGNFPGITAGQSYWLKPTKDVVLNPRGKLVDQTQPYSIPLVTGWNMIGSVYLQDINWSAVKVTANGQTLGISAAGAFVRPVAWTYNKTSGGYDIVSLPNGVLSTGRGYWVRALQPCQLVLAPPGSRAAVEGRDAVDRAESLQVSVRSGNRSDTSNYVPLTNSGNSRLALMEKPPYLGDYVTVRFLDSNSVTLPADSRAAAASAANVVAFQVETNRKNADVTMQFPNLSTLGRRNEVTLVDLSTGTRSALGNTAGTTYNTGDNTAPRQFALIITSVTANNRLVISSLQATGGNTRSPAVQFSYTISGNASVRAQIIGGAGATVVRNLDSGRAAPAGANTLTWDGRDNRGSAVPSGSYLLRLTATDDKGHSATAVIPVIVTR